MADALRKTLSLGHSLCPPLRYKGRVRMQSMSVHACDQSQGGVRGEGGCLQEAGGGEELVKGCGARVPPARVHHRATRTAPQVGRLLRVILNGAAARETSDSVLRMQRNDVQAVLRL